jgi:hypothetical protein
MGPQTRSAEDDNLFVTLTLKARSWPIINSGCFQALVAFIGAAHVGGQIERDQREAGLAG